MYFFIGHLNGYMEEIEGSSDKHLVVASKIHNKNIISVNDIARTLINDKLILELIWYGHLLKIKLILVLK